jgi:hypothetical protein
MLRHNGLHASSQVTREVGSALREFPIDRGMRRGVE